MGEMICISCSYFVFFCYNISDMTKDREGFLRSVRNAFNKQEPGNVTASRLHVPRGRILKARKEMGLSKKPGPVPSVPREEIQEALHEHLTPAQMAKRFSVDRSTIFNLLNNLWFYC